jgi:hypothetical protein
MIPRRQLLSIIIGALVLTGTMPAAMAAAPTAPMTAPSPGVARVWFLRPESATIGAYGASPMIYANGVPIGALSVNSKFYRDFAAGTYRFTVERYGILTDQAVTAQLTPATQTYLEVQWLPTWEPYLCRSALTGDPPSDRPGLSASLIPASARLCKSPQTLAVALTPGGAVR